MIRALGLLAALAVGFLPIDLWPGRWLGCAALLATLVSAGGVLLPSPGVATAGGVLGMLAFAVALIFVPPGGALLPSLIMGTALLILLDMTALGARSARGGLGAGVLAAHLARLGLAIVLAAALLPVLAAPAGYLPTAWSGVFRPLFAVAGGLIAFAGVAKPFLGSYTTSSIRNG
ncbi:MAG: hypothetical protein M0002_09225, partial [Rhodospirillales bacterium]|nr:hypothetical protein [Rhodospirillales bacterium]